MDVKERRSFVRGNFEFKIQYKVVTSEEYKAFKRSDEAIFSPPITANGTGSTDIKTETFNATNASLINYLVQIDTKLDLILELISKEKKVETPFRYAIGQNISGSGMQMVVDKPVESGNIIRSKFLLSKFPFVFMDIFGKVIHKKPMNRDGNTLYQLGVEFFDLSTNDQEKIIASVFQQQREAIRKNKIAAQNEMSDTRDTR